MASGSYIIDKMDVEQLIQILQEFKNEMDDYHKKRMAIFDAHHKSIMACFGQRPRISG
jgi:hypothetical protein